MPRAWLAVAAALVACAVSSNAGAEQPSLDCLKASAPLEQLICSDPELLALDAAVGEASAAREKQAGAQRQAVLAEQREWLGQRLRQCDVPASGDVVGDALRWHAAPCLDALYRARLTALGIAPQTSPAPPAAAATPGFVHPDCLWPIVDQEPGGARQTPLQVPLNECGRGMRHIPVKETEPETFAAQGASDGYFTWLSYRTIGTLPEGQAITIVRYNAGGTGVFSELYLLRRTSGSGGETLLSGEQIGGGGDRCNGGIEAARLIDPRTLEVDYQVTPQDLLAEADEQLAEDNIDALAFCERCCTGTVRRRVDIGSKEETTVSATVDRLLSENADVDAGDPAQACFDRLIRARAPQLPHTFTSDELRSLAAAFAKQCGSR